MLELNCYINRVVGPNKVENCCCFYQDVLLYGFINIGHGKNEIIRYLSHRS